MILNHHVITIIFHPFPSHSRRIIFLFPDLHGDLFGCQPFTVWIRLSRKRKPELHNQLPDPNMCLNIFKLYKHVATYSNSLESFAVLNMFKIFRIFSTFDQNVIAHTVTNRHRTKTLLHPLTDLPTPTSAGPAIASERHAPPTQPR